MSLEQIVERLSERYTMGHRVDEGDNQTDVLNMLVYTVISIITLIVMIASFFIG